METKHSEYHYKSEKSDTVIVFVHGIQGSPLQFDFLIETLKESYSIENLLLPGHGKTVREFIKSNIVQWQSYVDERVEKLQEEYKNIILVGHSMGCLLSVQSAITNPQNIRGLFLIAMPLNIHISYPFIKNNLIVAFSKNDRTEIIAAARNGNSISASNPFKYLGGAPRYVELLKKSKTKREHFKKLELPMIIVQSANDEIVSNKFLHHVEKMHNIKVVIASNSGHYFYSQEAKEHISKILMDFIAEMTKGC